jgi:hypothetical protein
MNDKCLLTRRDVQIKHSSNHLNYTLNLAGEEVVIFICDS